MPPPFSHNEATLRGVLFTLMLAELVWIASMLGSIYEDHMEWDPLTGLPLPLDDDDVDDQAEPAVAPQVQSKPTFDSFLSTCRIGPPSLVSLAVYAIFDS
ncbi:hypothetical protein CORC01_09554 [Colletotrichum orchidophilum]|uniref:Uncharacterized protein n=1 Tax=Colletotrichum orchidophilum TaxID=1209926 RepID=A0A1G4B1B3_9PEZI|nr:uncharacterized protein CORC01_09554 [Colletotrichum orchidophilum]OHE95167.1 hypothetical protein CORC01_09554 [Colletotrichum orchidophilum]